MNPCASQNSREQSCAISVPSQPSILLTASIAAGTFPEDDLQQHAYQYMRLKWVAMKMPGPHWGAGQTLRKRCTLPESSTCNNQQ